MRRIALCLAAAVLAQAGFSKTVGVLQGGRDVIAPGMIKTLEDDGWAHTNVTLRDLENTNKLAGVDVLLFTGGWNSYFFPNAAAARILHGFVAEGKGILASGFRSGYSRTASRPLFPQVALTYNRAVSSLIVPVGDSPLAKAVKAPFFSSGSVDHMPLLVGPEGKVFARCAGDDVGAYGEIYGGRYIALGAFIGGNASTNGMTGADRDAFLGMMNWLNGAPKDRSAPEVAKAKERALLDLLRRERLWDWTFDGQGPGVGPGFVPGAHHTVAGVLESRLYHLEYLGTFFGKQPEEIGRLAKETRQVLAKMDQALKRKTSEVERRINRMNAAELKAFNAAAKDEIASLRDLFLPAERLTALRTKLDDAIKVWQVQANKSKAERYARERQTDAAQVPGIVQTLTEGGVEARRQAALELARIGAPACAPALIAALKDADEPVRVNAILGLGWMQAKKAVPALIELAKGTEVRMKRRAAQALGQIGDARAIPTLMASLQDADATVVQNAIFALGWLKAKEAVPDLIRFATAPAANDWRKAEWRPAAFRALGRIGDERALAGLEKEIASTNAAALAMAAAIRDAKLRARPAGIAQPA
ncbi:MAG: HEAT repeat domain-containing protein, partial [Lentisphaerae bacterium]|nr:HEAT repeat domain-containing protein [Lentisphaerota bacterium]